MHYPHAAAADRLVLHRDRRFSNFLQQLYAGTACVKWSPCESALRWIQPRKDIIFGRKKKQESFKWWNKWNWVLFVTFATLCKKMIWVWAVVVVQVVEGSLPTPEIHSSNSVIGKFYFLSTCIEKMNKEKICQEWPNLKKMIWICITDVGRVQVVERSLPTPQIHSSNSVIGKF